MSYCRGAGFGAGFFSTLCPHTDCADRAAASAISAYSCWHIPSVRNLYGAIGMGSGAGEYFGRRGHCRIALLRRQTSFRRNGRRVGGVALGVSLDIPPEQLLGEPHQRLPGGVRAYGFIFVGSWNACIGLEMVRPRYLLRAAHSSSAGASDRGSRVRSLAGFVERPLPARGDRTRILIATAGLLLTVSPWTLRNYAYSDDSFRSAIILG